MTINPGSQLKQNCRSTKKNWNDVTKPKYAKTKRCLFDYFLILKLSVPNSRREKNWAKLLLSLLIIITVAHRRYGDVSTAGDAVGCWDGLPVTTTMLMTSSNRAVTAGSDVTGNDVIKQWARTKRAVSDSAVRRRRAGGSNVDTNIVTTWTTTDYWLHWPTQHSYSYCCCCCCCKVRALQQRTAAPATTTKATSSDLVRTISALWTITEYVFLFRVLMYAAH